MPFHPSSKVRSLCLVPIVLLTGLLAGFHPAAGQTPGPVQATSDTDARMGPPRHDGAVLAATGPFTLRVQVSEGRVGSFSVLVQSKSEISMLLAPATTLVSQMNVEGALTLAPPLDGKPGRFPEFLTTLQASLSYYAPGEANKEIDPEIVRRGLLVSGIPEIGKEMRAELDSLGNVIEVTGIPASFVPYFKVSLLSYPENSLAIGDSWQHRQALPVAFDVYGEPAWCRMIATFSLVDAVPAEDRFTLGIQAVMEPEPGPPGSASSPVRVSGTIEGTVQGRLSDGFPRSLETSSKGTIDFGFSNVIRMEQRYDAHYHLPELPVKGKP